VRNVVEGIFDFLVESIFFKKKWKLVSYFFLLIFDIFVILLIFDILILLICREIGSLYGLFCSIGLL